MVWYWSKCNVKTSQIAYEEKVRVAKFRALNNLGEADFKALTQNFGKYLHRFATYFFRIKFSFFGEKLTLIFEFPAKFLNENMESVTPDLTCSYLWYICILPVSSCAECAKQKPFTPKPEAREVLEWLKENSPIVHSPCPPQRGVIDLLSRRINYSKTEKNMALHGEGEKVRRFLCPNISSQRWSWFRWGRINTVRRCRC